MPRDRQGEGEKEVDYRIIGHGDQRGNGIEGCEINETTGWEIREIKGDRRYILLPISLLRVTFDIIWYTKLN